MQCAAFIWAKTNDNPDFYLFLQASIEAVFLFKKKYPRLLNTKQQRLGAMSHYNV